MPQAEDAELRSIVRRGFCGAELVAFRGLNGGVSARATLVELRLPGGALKRVVVRRPSEDAAAVVRREHALLERCAELGISSPAPCYLDREASAVVLEYVEGAPDFAPSNLDAMLEQMAAQLARIHRVPIDDRLAMLELRRNSAARQITLRPARLDASLNELELRRILRELWPWPELNRDALLHGDYWPGNLLFEQGRLKSVLDWEEAELGDPLADVALARLDLLWAFGEPAAEAFTEHYRRLSSIDWTNLSRWELCVALRPLGQLARWASAYQAAPISRPDITAASMAEGHRRFVESALARL